MTLLSFAFLSVSWVLVTTIYWYPDPFWGLGDDPGDYLMVLVFFIGLAASFVGGLVSASAIHVVRDRLWPTSILLLALWLEAMGYLEPGSW